MYCSACGTTNAQGVETCATCGDHLSNVEEVAPPYAYTPSAFQFALLYFVTGGLYTLYWLYKLWRATAAILSKEDHPWRNTLLFLLPLYNVYQYYNLLADVTASVHSAGLRPRAPLVLLGFLGAIVDALWRLPGNWWYFCFLAFVPLAIVQYYITEAQLRLWGQTVTPYRYRWGDWLVIVLGSIILALNTLAVLLPASGKLEVDAWVWPTTLVVSAATMVVFTQMKRGGTVLRPVIA